MGHLSTALKVVRLRPSSARVSFIVHHPQLRSENPAYVGRRGTKALILYQSTRVVQVGLWCPLHTGGTVSVPASACYVCVRVCVRP